MYYEDKWLQNRRELQKIGLLAYNCEGKKENTIKEKDK
jgi:hypothetical protein